MKEDDVVVRCVYVNRKNKRRAMVLRMWTTSNEKVLLVYRYTVPLDSRSNRGILIEHCKDVQCSVGWFAERFEVRP